MRIDTVGMKRKIVWPWLLQSVSLQKHLGGIRALYDITKKWISRILQHKFSMKSKGIYLIILTNVHLMNCQIQLVFKCIVLLFLWIYVHILIHVSAFQLNRKKKQLFKFYVFWIMLLPWRLQTALVKKRRCQIILENKQLIVETSLTFYVAFM